MHYLARDVSAGICKRRLLQTVLEVLVVGLLSGSINSQCFAMSNKIINTTISKTHMVCILLVPPRSNIDRRPGTEEMVCSVDSLFTLT